ncbi:MAG: IMP dehydrogenase [Spirochaetales bacterium]|nr:IMP dehydrogenase [Spirochaetales bacterium]
MAEIYPELSRTFSEYILIPNLTEKDHVSENVSLKTPVVKYKKGGESLLSLNIPFTSAIMQAVSNHTMAIALARSGGISFIFASQPIEKQVAMVRKVKYFKAGFVESDSNLRPDQTLHDVLALNKKTDHTTIAITEDGSPHGKLLGILTSRDYRINKCDLNTPVKDVMTPFPSLIYAEDGISLEEANDMIWKHKLNSLPVVNSDRCLLYLVFRKDYDEHMRNPLELVDKEKRLIVGAGINTRDYKERVPELVNAGADILCIDSSDGFSEWQHKTIAYVKETWNGEVKIGAGNVVEREGFNYLADAGADFIKIGIGGGAICITREQKGIGLGQATAVIEVAKARDEYFQKTGEYIPICSDGGIVHDNNILLALAMGADFVMMGRYFARFDESPGKKMKIKGNFVKEYWGEGTERARNWARYGYLKQGKLPFEEGVDAYVPYAGKLKDNIELTVSKIKATMCNCGALDIPELHRKARIALVSSLSMREGTVHDVIFKETDLSNLPT